MDFLYWSWNIARGDVDWKLIKRLIFIFHWLLNKYLFEVSKGLEIIFLQLPLDKLMSRNKIIASRNGRRRNVNGKPDSKSQKYTWDL